MTWRTVVVDEKLHTVFEPPYLALTKNDLADAMYDQLCFDPEKGFSASVEALWAVLVGRS